LRRFEALGPRLAAHGVEVIALSKDSPEDAARHRERDGISFQLLSDPDLIVIRDYGAEHHRAIEFSKLGFTMFGIPLALVPSFETMAIPTTILIDEHGVVRWIDQSEDYRLRSDEARVMAAVERLFERTGNFSTA
jgi:peroxiredoxin